jgi:hypothetical protein
MKNILPLLLFYVLLSFADLGLTYVLVGDDPTLELNPVAKVIVRNNGFEGLIRYKLLAISLVVLSIFTIALRRKDTAIKVALLACILSGAVVLYSLGLIGITLLLQALH